MDDRRFDALVRGLASGQSRRSVLKGLLGLGGATLAGRAASGSTEAARRPTPAPTPKPVKCPGKQTWNGSACVCPSGTNCGPDCCTGGAVCCDNACCTGQCYGEELCCPTGQIVCNGNCCAAGEVCFQGACLRCTICGDDCCLGDTPRCCLNGETSTCAPAGATCCTADTDCRGLDFCDGLTAHTFSCVDAVCTESTKSCQGTDPCYQYNCNQGVCGSTRNEGCCTSGEQCSAADTCTPARCLDNHTCNAVSNCVSGEQCCSGTCASTEDRCCTGDRDCAGLDFCGETDAYHYACIDHVCTRQTEDCLGDNPCVDYGCSNGTCTSTPRPGCCEVDEACDPADDCTPARCLGNGTCNTVSGCGSGELCCDNGTCSTGGSCGGCTIEGVTFPPCAIIGCPTCVAPDGGTLCGCASTTGTACTSTDMCKDLLGNAICAVGQEGPICVVPANPPI